MAIQYSGIPRSSLIAGDTKALLIGNLEAEFGAAGWSTISGAGTTDVVLHSTSPQGLAMRLRLYDAGGNCAQLIAQNGSGSIATQPAYLLPAAAKQFRCLITPATFFVFTPGSSAAREFAAGGICYILPVLLAEVSSSIWLNGNAYNDGDSTVRSSFRTLLTSRTTSAAGVNSGIWNDSLMNQASATGMGPGQLQLQLPAATYSGDFAAVGWRWHTNDLLLIEPNLTWGLTSAQYDEGKVGGQMYDCFLNTEAWAGDQQVPVGDKTFWAVTNGNSGTSSYRKGTLFMRCA